MDQVSVLSIVCISVHGILGIAIPIIACILLRKRAHADLLPFFTGFAVMILFAFVFERIAHTIILGSPAGQVIKGHLFLYCLYGGLMAGLFEETGRFLAFRTVLAKRGKMTKNVNALTNLKPEPEIDKRGKISDMLKVGEYVLVQIAKEPISSKGPRLTCEISIAGRNLVLLPFTDKVSVSQKIKSTETRKRLRSWIEGLVPKNFGAIVRTVAQDKNVVELDKELTSLLDKWKSLFEHLSTVEAPNIVLGEMNRTTAFLRDMLNSSFHQIVVNDVDLYNEVKKFISEIAPEKSKIVKLYTDRTPIFDSYGIEKQIKTAFGRTVPMRSGAYIVIDHTEAGHVIDVNSGNRANSKNDQETNALEVNLIAAEEIARQLRLRDMGGIIVVDFIDVHSSESKKAIYDKMKECMANDRAKYHLTQLSRFCLMEITRQRVRPATDMKTAETCPCCNGTGKIQASLNLTDEIENQLKYILRKNQVDKIVIRTHPFVEAYINKGIFKSLRKQWQKLYGCKIEVLPMMAYSYME